jgi:Lon protease-like protein
VRDEPGVLTLPSEFPVFPLNGALLLPRGRLPLNIFERRYLAMVDDALGAGRIFGMVQPNPKLRTDDNGPGLYRIGCLGRLSSFSETDDGRYLITLTGLSRFEIVSELPGRRGYRRVRGNVERFTEDLDLPGGGSGFDRNELLAALRAYFSRRGFDANWDAISQMEDDALVVTLCMVCPFEPVEKQALLEADTPADRAQALLALLRIDAFGSRGETEQDGDGPSRAS